MYSERNRQESGAFGSPNRTLLFLNYQFVEQNSSIIFSAFHCIKILKTIVTINITITYNKLNEDI